MSEGVHEELGRRGRWLVEHHGQQVDQPRRSEPLREFHLDNIWIVMDSMEHLEIRGVFNSTRRKLVYAQRAPLWRGTLLYPEKALDVLNAMRRFMVLEDLASV